MRSRTVWAVVYDVNYEGDFVEPMFNPRVFVHKQDAEAYLDKISKPSDDPLDPVWSVEPFELWDSYEGEPDG